MLNSETLEVAIGMAFIFVGEAKARRYLHELWLRDHECWAIVDGKRTAVAP